MATTQMNIRIEEREKAEGDAVFEKLGYTPTQVVRTIWGYAASLKNNPEAVGEMLRAAERAINPSLDQERVKRVQAAEDALSVFPATLENMGIDANDLPVVDSDDWIEQARYRHAVEKGWIEPSKDLEPVQGGDIRQAWNKIAEKVRHG